MNLLQAMRFIAPDARMYFAGSSEQFGNVDEICHEKTPFAPVSPYAVTKTAGYQLCGVYRQAYGLRISRGIAFNHESPRRSDEFVTRKITRTLARIKLGSKEKLRLGNVNSARDWGHADEYVRAMWAMLQDDKPGDYVIATGRTHTVIDFVTEACHALQLGGDPRQFVDYDENLERTVELKRLRADPSRIYDKLRWKAVTPFCDLVGEMCVADLRREQSKVYI
jgi:GDPmannose 4,6-dehydratase